MSGLIAVGYFLLSLFFDVILFTLWMRIALRYLRISSLNPFSRLIYTFTNPVIGPLYSLLRYQDLAKQRYDWPVLILIFFIEVLKVILLCLITFQTLFPFVYILLYAVADFIIQPCNLLFFAILARVIMSYVNPFWNHPMNDFLKALTNPLLVVGRKIVPNISGFDFSPFIMMIILKVITLFIHASLPVRLL
ncbi:YggT family protein [Legionella sp. km772]|uniref:YggT family protein n=1 Tax=Legionella sp. km772 TaxID=2498111 RepID=UPI000F8EF240|nr:YggT family protein [Legionella sp. km772]RUR09164.1 YggT family protein [Legionella sp. km772]